MYQALAKIYDTIMTRADYPAWVDFVWQAHQRLQLPFPKQALDLAAGTASVGLELAKRGVGVLAVDQSMEMLLQAKARALNLGLSGRFRFQQADLALWQAPKEAFDLAVCSCDGLNYLSKDGICSLFKQLAACLQPGALFIFDLTTPFKFREIFAHNVFAENFPDFSYIWENDLKADSCDFMLTIFLKEGRRYQKYQERHTQYIYTVEELGESLAGCGFSWRGIFDAYSWREPEEECQRWTVIAQR